MTNTLPGKPSHYVRILLAGLTAGLTLGACATPTPGRVTDVVTSGASAALSPSPTASAHASTARVGGQAFRYPDGVTVQVKSLVRFTPSSTSAGHVLGNAGVIATVIITNNSPAPFDASLVIVNLSAGADGTQAPTVTDVEKNIGMGITGTVAPGRSLSARYGFSVAPKDLGSIAVEVTPDFNHAGAIFVGAVK